MGHTREELKSVLDQFVKYGDSLVRVNLAKMGYALDVFVNDNDKDVRVAVANQGYGLDKLLMDDCSDVRAAVARQGYGLDILLTDSAWHVRAEVAKHGYGLDRLVHDWHSGVRMEVAKQRFGLDILVDDDVWSVRKIVAQQGYGLDKLMHDKVCSVRVAVAQQGYGLGVLANDAEEEVRDAAQFFLRTQERIKQAQVWASLGYTRYQKSDDSSSFGENKRETHSGASRDGLLKNTGVFAGNRGADADFSVDKLMGILEQVLYLADSDTKRRVIETGYGLDFFVNDFDVDVREKAREHKAQALVADILAEAVRRSDAARESTSKLCEKVR